MQMTGVIANRTCTWEILCHHVHVLIVKGIQYTVLPLYVIRSGIRHAWKMGRGSWSWYVAAAPPSRRPPRACAWRRRSPWPGRHERHICVVSSVRRLAGKTVVHSERRGPMLQRPMPHGGGRGELVGRYTCYVPWIMYLDLLHSFLKKKLNLILNIDMIILKYINIHYMLVFYVFYGTNIK